MRRHDVSLSFRQMNQIYADGLKAIWSQLLELLAIRSRKTAPRSPHCSRVSVAYGFRQFAPILGGNLQLSASEILRMNHMDTVSSNTLVLYHLASLAIWFGGCVVTSLVGTFMIQNFMPEIDQQIMNLLRSIVDLSCLAYHTLGLAINLVFIYKRKQISYFLSETCSQIQIDRDILQPMTRLYLLFIMVGFISEPLIFYFVMYKSLGRTEYMMQLGPNVSTLLRCVMVATILPASFAILAIYHVVPAMDVYLSCALSECIRMRVADLADLRTSACRQHHDALTDDWSQIQTPANDGPPSKSQATGLTFDIVPTDFLVYRRVIKTLIQVIKVLRAYEQLFPYIHAVFICQSTFTLSTLVCLRILRTRLDNDMVIMNKINSHKTENLYFSNMGSLTALVIVVHVMVMILLFNRAHQLPEQLEHLKSELFNNNLESLKNYAATSKTSAMDVWSMYDTIDRLCAQAHLKFVGQTNYSKRLLLEILGKQLSFCLLYVQFVDIYYVMSDRFQ